MTATALWTAVVASYPANGLISLTNIDDAAATTINTTFGENAAQAVIDLWPIYAQEAYDSSDATHVEVAKEGVIAMLWRRGGTSNTIAEVKWDSVFSPDGLISRVRRTGSRGHGSPSSNSGVSTKSELSNGRAVRGWADRDSLPPGYMPRRVLADD